MAGSKHGYAIIADIEAQAGKRLGPGTLYGIIARLENSGLIRALRMEERGRRPYAITAAGRQIFKEEVESLGRYQRAIQLLAGG